MPENESKRPLPNPPPQGGGEKHIAVLKGGWSAEREVSLVSGAACAKALRELGYRVTEIDAQPDLADVLAKTKPDAVFNALHGRWGEDGCVQGLLELMKIPYTHSGVLASALAMDKPMAKKIFEAAGLRCPEGKIVSREELLKGDSLPRPYVIKPPNEGSSVGVYIVTQEDNRPIEMIVASDKLHVASEEQSNTCSLQLATSYLVEKYIHGRELTVAVLNDQPLAVTELRVNDGFYDYEHKYTGGKTTHLCPAPVSPEVQDAAMAMALKAHQALGCRGLSRADIRYDDAWPGGRGLYLLEVNTQPGFTPLSLTPEQAAYRGINFNELVRLLVEDAKLGG